MFLPTAVKQMGGAGERRINKVTGFNKEQVDDGSSLSYAHDDDQASKQMEPELLALVKTAPPLYFTVIG